MARWLLLALIRSYRAGISPLLPGACRYTPTCSEYALVAVRRFGARKGGWMAVRRILRCHPFGGFGPDPVPGGPGRSGHGEDESSDGSESNRN